MNLIQQRAIAITHYLSNLAAGLSVAVLQEKDSKKLAVFTENILLEAEMIREKTA